MFPLVGSQTPDSPETLETALRAGLETLGLRPHGVRASGEWPNLDLVRVDLSGSKLDRAQPLPEAKAAPRTDFHATRFELVAEPIYLEGAPAVLSVQAADAGFGSAAGSALVLTEASEGEIVAEIERGALEKLLQQVAGEAASQHGVDIKQTKLELNALGPRLLAFRADVTAKMFVMSATVTLSGQVEVDDQMQAKVSQLRFTGDGMIANAAGGFIRPQLEKFEGRTFALMTFSLGEIKLRDLQVTGGDSLRLTARFGS
ncbi:MAG TPA: hypothetical protein VF593_14440 [Chthoniobacteraceae bacterium]